MAISFPGAKNYKKHNGLPASINLKEPIASPVYFYPIVQNNGITLTPTVKIGERVLCGQKIADLDNFTAIPAISSVSGKVTSITENMIVVENDMLYDKYPVTPTTKSEDELTMREKLWIMRESGVYDIRTGTPAHIILSEKKTPEYAIVCCFDSDPYVSSPQAAAADNAEKILYGLHIVMDILGTKKAIVAVQNDSKKTYYDFKYHLRYNTDISLYCLKARFPQSHDDILIKTLTGKSYVKAIVFSSETLCNIADAIREGKPVTNKIVTVSGDDILAPDNFRVLLGAPVSSLLEHAGYSEARLIFTGGITTGKRITDLDTPVTACTNSLIAFNDGKNIPRYRKKYMKKHTKNTV
ncbi:MAG: hypothetical protein J1F01_07175 [Oscillospiraceae bacterium]|nr:hypothetical protein [Oscillospiraceae bacterium]